MEYPALDVSGADNDLLLALLDDFSPTAIEDHDSRLTAFFADASQRDLALRAVASAWPDAGVSARDVDDEDWARRSLENLGPVTIGRISVCPPWSDTGLEPVLAWNPQASTPSSAVPAPPARPSTIRIVIAPSMGFGTGHHATTRLCLAAMQTVDLAGRRALDIGTGSGVLAIAARLLGADEAIGVDCDADAVNAAADNLAHNPAVDRVRFVVGDLRELPLPQADLVTANLTGALLVQSAPLLLSTVAGRGTLIISGLLKFERENVLRAFAGARLVWEAAEDEWVGLGFNPDSRIEV